MTTFIDPRSDPEPPAQITAGTATHGEELRDLVHLCLAGHVYDVERWIQNGRPIQALTYKRPKKPAVVSPMRAAIRTKHRDIVLLLLCNGYRLEPEATDGHSVLDEALTIRAFDILDLLLTWGADPRTARPCNVVDTYRTELIDQFWKRGVDYAADSEFVLYLAHTVNKPLYGWLRRNRSTQGLQDALDVALLEAVTEDKELPVRLLLWAGADPHREVPMIRDLHRPNAWDEGAVFSSATAAITFGRHQLFDLLRIPAMPDFQAQFSWAHDSWTLKKLATIRAPSDWSGVILSFIGRLWRPFGAPSFWDVRDALGFIASSGGRLVTASPDQIRRVRSVLIECSDSSTVTWLLRWLRNENNCEPTIYAEVTRTDAMRQRIEAVNLGARYLSPSRRMARATRQRRRPAK